MNKFFTKILSVIIVFLCTCTHNDSTGPHTDGGASETIAIIITESMIKGKIKSSEENQTDIPNLDIKLYNNIFLPFLFTSKENHCDSTLSDDKGEFEFNITTNRIYTLYAKDISTGESFLIYSISGQENLTDTLYDSLLNPGKVTGNIYFVDSTNDTLNAYPYFVFIPGTPFFTSTNSDGAFSLDSIPEGEYYIMPIDDIGDSLIDLSNSLLLNKIKVKKYVSIESGKTKKGVDMYLEKFIYTRRYWR